MIVLENKDYYKAIEPLSYVSINTLFAEAVIEQRIPGKIYVDSVQEPSTFYVAHPYGMSLLFGNSDNEQFNRDLYEYINNQESNIRKSEWLQVDPAGTWADKIDSMTTQLNEQQIIMKNTRVNFSFNLETYHQMKEQLRHHDHEIIQMTKDMFLSQTGGVIPRYFWRDVDQFLTVGMGYSLVCEGEIASTAFSAFRNEHQLEIGIETAEAHYGKGYALSVCSALIEYCLDHQLEPVWACRLDNESSYKLAQRLGFEPTLNIPYYRLECRGSIDSN
ncbi:RimJ/RimL family protein N-acetyltransferase [Paenibacillus anaericanus]|uniref:GNAT family N-acetyltransferase n=1 Tax=Paenibacillus anaericanus TaxID=170367 RepID=UPI00278610D7|nr:GNAT family N-acetyltransferase [Paenibacillus anaericanus]MDQ0087919.1 RimJ/RimL family protein N-acetyltransferase [Paenibacillus anaericanus]